MTRTHLTGARSAAGRTGDAADRAVAAWAAAQVAWAAGEPGEVLPAVEVLAAGPGDASGHLPWRELRADALVALGRVVEAEAAIGDLERAADERGRRSMLAAARVLRGRLAARRGDDAPAVADYREGAALFAELRMPFPRAAAEAALGAQLRRRGCRTEALALLTAARQTFARLGAVTFVGRVDREVVACGGSRTGDCSVLTPQESQVARLVADGLTNRQVAEELVVSVKTVEYHLGHVFAKLGMRSRAQLAATLARSAGP
ncbi:helix-turn-helix transcriptional regulator [Blastococcus sp. CCUG 61487]|uniref:helix-turn-helix transcriptional regulator n=1 Tax=Blastococcus sp. CCUG 61487 TaxID=1840703 RepID=UPI0010C0C9CF|nr:helix-turn-helix transcriptional regulator [Blastococcus sp. CCUG 61487]